MYISVADDEIPAVVRLINRAYRGSGGSSGWNSEEAYISGDRTTSELLRAEIAAKPLACLLKWVNENTAQLCGCVWLEPLPDGIWYLGSLAIDPDLQNSGLGRIMVDAAEERALQGGAVRIRMSVVNIRDTLIAWYNRRGYVETGVTEAFPYDDERFGRPLRQDLRFVVLEKQLKDAGT